MYLCILGSKTEINSVNLSKINRSFSVKTFSMGAHGQSKNKTWGILEELAQLPCKAFINSLITLLSAGNREGCSLTFKTWIKKYPSDIRFGRRIQQSISEFGIRMGCLRFLFPCKRDVPFLREKQNIPQPM